MSGVESASIASHRLYATSGHSHHGTVFPPLLLAAALLFPLLWIATTRPRRAFWPFFKALRQHLIEE